MDSGHLFEESLPTDLQKIASGSDSDPVEDALLQQGHLTCLRRYQAANIRDRLSRWLEPCAFR